MSASSASGRSGRRRPSRSGGGSAIARRVTARLAAVQALYQMDLAGTSVDGVIGEFISFRIGQEQDGEQFVPADPTLFSAIVRGVCERRLDVDAMLRSSLDPQAGSSPERLEALLRAILRAGTFELLAHADMPSRLLVSAYVDLAHAFFSGREPALVNGILDRLARVLRPDTLPGRAAQIPQAAEVADAAGVAEVADAAGVAEVADAAGAAGAGAVMAPPTVAGPAGLIEPVGQPETPEAAATPASSDPPAS